MLWGLQAFKEGRRTVNIYHRQYGSQKKWFREETFRVDEFTVKQWELFQQNQDTMLFSNYCVC